MPTSTCALPAPVKALAAIGIGSRARLRTSTPGRRQAPALTTWDRQADSLSPWRRARLSVRTVQPLIAPLVMPATICRLKKTYIRSGGIVISRMFANSKFHWFTAWLWKL